MRAAYRYAREHDGKPPGDKRAEDGGAMYRDAQGVSDLDITIDEAEFSDREEYNDISFLSELTKVTGETSTSGSSTESQVPSEEIRALARGRTGPIHYELDSPSSSSVDTGASTQLPSKKVSPEKEKEKVSKAFEGHETPPPIPRNLDDPEVSLK